MNNARETERERETRGTIYYTCSSLVSLLACIAHNCVNTWNYIWRRKKKKKKKKKHGRESHFPKKRDVMYWLCKSSFHSHVN